MSYVGVDEGADKKIATIQKTESSDTIDLQRVAIDGYTLKFLEIINPAKAVDTVSDAISCLDKDRVFVKVLFRSSSDTTKLRFIYVDSDGNPTISDEISVVNTAIEDRTVDDVTYTWYHSESLSVDVLYFSKYRIMVTSQPSSAPIRILAGGASGDFTKVVRAYLQGGYGNYTNLERTDYYVVNTWTNTIDGASLTEHCATDCYSNIIFMKGSISPTVYQLSGLFSWVTKTHYPSPIRRNSGAASPRHEDFNFVGGYDTSNAVKTNAKYSPDTWSLDTDLPSPGLKYLVVTRSYKSYVYAVNGQDSSNTDYKSVNRLSYGSWSSKTDTPSPARHGNIGEGIDGSEQFWIVGGESGSTPLNDTDEYSSNTWTSKTNLPSPSRTTAASGMLNSKVYIYSGIHYSTALKDTDEYYSNTWTNRLDTLSPSRYISAGASV